MIHTSQFLQVLSGKAPEYTKFQPDQEFSIRSNSSRRRIRINIYEPSGFDKSKSYPVHLNFHGSGFMVDMFGTDSDFCRMVSDSTGAIVLDCDYAKGGCSTRQKSIAALVDGVSAPESPFPAATDDVKDVIDHVVANAEGYFDTSRITIGGFSAGGTLALTAGVSQPKNTLKAVVSLYPCADLALESAIKNPPPVSKGNSNPIPPWFNQLVRDSYTPPGTDMSDPRLSPANTPVSSLPERVLIVVCEEDPLRYDGVVLAKRLQAEGANVALKEIPKVVHIWDKSAVNGTSGAEAKYDAYEAMIDTLRAAYGL
ncbi:Alpha/beta hydrolase fold protein [Ceratobasidium theobromae]|uniref:Alpha/beta hydrolase fold protein n=1 Tax=Ceratobasidium theobromae TaxID=1582974 RepID=A0A5N5QK85_9AGAM|nr:Alpha/beta hydrolase fold protein [Ceratobasidium theobromae]